MNLLSQILAGMSGVALLIIGPLEILRHGDQRLHSLFLIAPEDVPAVRMWAMNIGAYNVTFGLGIACGLWMLNGPGLLEAGTALVVFCCVSQFLLGIWLWVTERRLLFSAFAQATPPGLAVVTWLLWG